MNMVDSHCHVLDPARFPYSREAAYIPPAELRASVNDFIATLDQHGVSHALLVSPTAGYNYDNTCMTDALTRYPNRFRGIARLRADVDLDTLHALSAQGVIGARLDLIGDGLEVLEHPMFDRWLTHVRSCNWLLQVQCEGDQLAQAARTLTRYAIPLLIDHCGRPDVSLGVDQPGFATLLSLGHDGHYVKLSGAFRFSRQAYPHADCDPFVAALIDAFTPSRCVWGSDWPFLRIQGAARYSQTLEQLERWLPDARRQEVASVTPQRLFGFAQSQ